MQPSLPFALLALLPLSLPRSSPIAPVQAPPSSQAERLLDRLQTALTERYVFKDKARWLNQSLLRTLALGEYRDLTTAQLGPAITGHLRSWTQDKHFMVAHMPALAEELEERARRGEPEVPGDDPGEASANYGIGRVEMLDDAVGLIRLESIAFSPSTVAAFQEALTRLPEAMALILDLRDNHGGGADTVPGLVSCFFPKGQRVTLGTKYWRPDDEETPIETDGALAGVRYLEHPILILTSENTRSAAEALAYHLRAFGLAYVIGERTSGGAHLADMISLGDGFVALLPMGWTRSSQTGTDWEARGVPLDIACEADEAEAVALDLAWRLIE